MIVSPSVSAIRKEKGVCGKNLCGFFLHDFNQPAAAAHFCLRQKWESSKKGAVKKQPKEIWRVSSERLAIFFGLQWQVVENFW